MSAGHREHRVAAKSKSTSAADSLANGIRALIREELKKPAPAEIIETKPTWHDAMYVLFTIANLVLLVMWLPESWWKNPVLEVVGKIIPWVGGGFFLLGTAWFRDRVVEFSRRKWFKRTMIFALPILVLMHLRFIPMRPTVGPPGSELLIDGKMQERFQNSDNRIWVSLGSHTFVLKPPNGVPVTDRVIEWNVMRLLREFFGKREPRWAIVYFIYVKSDVGSTISFEKIDGDLDTDFEDRRLLKTMHDLEFKPEITAERIMLPYGSYKVSETKKGCDRQEKEIKVGGPVDNVEFEPMRCTSE